MEELEILTIDEKDYAVIDRIESTDDNYIYLANIEDENDFFIRKESQDGTLLCLNDDEEINNALNLFAKKHEEDQELN